MAEPAPSLFPTPSARSGQRSRSQAKLRLLPSPSAAARIHDEQRMEVAVIRADLLTHSTRMRSHLRTAMRHLAGGHLAAAATSLLEAEALNEQAAVRAVGMEAPVCGCGDADSGEMAA